MKAVRLIPILLVMSAASAQTLSNCSSELCRLIAEGRLADLHWPDFAGQRVEVELFYRVLGTRLVWTEGGHATARAKDIVWLLRYADEKGLNPEDYDGPRWADRLIALDQAAGLTPEDQVARFDVELTVSLMRYVSDLRFGKADPGLYRSGKEGEALSAIANRVLTTGDVDAEIQRLEPPFDGYKRTLKALQQYRILAKDDDGKFLPPTAKPLEPGAAYADIPGLVHRLQMLGDFPADAAPLPDSTRYDRSLVDAVKHFQLRHGLDADGRIGKATFAQLNVPLSHRLRQIELTLERWRWVPHQFPRPPIVLNLPEFELRAYDASYRPELEMKIVAGAAQRRQTPQFAGELQFVIFRPYWNVPMSIQRKELVPEIQRDRSYLGKHDYEAVTSKGAVVASGTVSDDVLSQLRSGKLLLRQRPGPNNALGLVKFIFPNEHDVYLHDTPSRSLFARARRDFSHGCMRVEKAEDLAVWVLQDDPAWPRDRIVVAMNGTKTVQVNLKRPIPVLIVYGTAVVAESGEVKFFDDVYGFDAALDKELTTSGPGQGPHE